jgi:hypothetical protein
LVVLYVLEIASLLLARRFRTLGFLKRDGLLVVTAPAGGTFSSDGLSGLLKRHFRHHAVQSVGVQDGKVSVQITFSGLKTEAVRLQEEIAQAFTTDSIHVFLDRPGGIR